MAHQDYRSFYHWHPVSILLLLIFVSVTVVAVTTVMRFLSLALSSLVLFPGVLGASALSSKYSEHTKHVRQKGCSNSPSNRACWSDDFDISTNYYEKVPDTGVVREYWFNVENTTATPDGVEMPVQLINGSFPAQPS
jgi:hypothetical protein